MSKTNRLVSGKDIVVGVDGTAASVSALRYAIGEAQRIGGGVQVVHVVPEFVSMTPMYPLPCPIPPEDFVAVGKTVLRNVMVQVGRVPSEVELRTALLRGPCAANLAAHARGARALVVGSDRRPVVERLLTGNTSTGVAATSVAPVVLVPEDWSARPVRGVVGVGVKGSAHAGALLGEAFTVAAARESRLLVVHAWKLPSAYDDIVAERVSSEEWNARARSQLQERVADLRSRFPGVEVEVRAVHDQAAQALVHVAMEVDELVLVRRAHGVPAAAHLGSTARTLLRESACPVRIVPPDHVVVGSGPVPEPAGSTDT